MLTKNRCQHATKYIYNKKGFYMTTLIPHEQLIKETLAYLSNYYSEYVEKTVTESLGDCLIESISQSNRPVEYITKIVSGGHIQLMDASNTESRGITTILTKQPIKSLYKHLLKSNNKELSDTELALKSKRLETLTAMLRRYNIKDTVISSSIVTDKTESYFFLVNEENKFVIKLLRISLLNKINERSKVGYYETTVDLSSLKHPVLLSFKLKNNRGGTRPNAGRKPNIR